MSLFELNTKGAAEEGFEVEILHPRTNLPIGVKITILGTDSDTFRNASRKQQNRRLENMKRGKATVTMTAEEIEAETIDLLATCTKSWSTGSRNQIEIAPNEWLDCNKENAKRLYADFGFSWLKEQVDREMGDRSNFLQS